MTQLYINNQLVELSEKIDYTINKTLFNLDDISSYQLDYSKTIKVPITDRNIEVFGYRNGQRVLTDLDGGLGFENTIDNKYRLYDNNQLISSGYVKFVKTHYSSKDKYFEITLNSDIANWANQLKDLSFATKVNENFEKDDDSKKTLGDYLFNDKNSFNVNRATIRQGWDLSFGRNFIPKYWNDYIGFVVTDSGLYDDYNNKKYQHYNLKIFNQNYIGKSKEVTEEDNYSSDVSEMVTHDLRSYYQRPVVYSNAFFTFIKEISKKKGFDIWLDPSFFNKNNPYYGGTGTLFPRLSLDSQSLTNNYPLFFNSNKSTYYATLVKGSGDYGKTAQTYNNSFYMTEEGQESVPDLLKDNTTFLTTEEYEQKIGVSLLLALQQKWDKLPDNPKDWGVVPSDLCAKIEFYLGVEDASLGKGVSVVSNTVTIDYTSFYDKAGRKTGAENQKQIVDLIFNKDLWYKDNGYLTELNFQIPVSYLDLISELPLKLYYRVTGDRFYNFWLTTYDKGKDFSTKSNGIIIKLYTGDADTPSETVDYSTYVQMTCATKTRSDSLVTIERICGEKFKIFDWLKNYCKIFNLQILQEDNKIKICQIPTIFKNYKKVIPKIDRSKWEINNNVFENKYFYLNWVDDKDNYLQSKYINENNTQYGEKKINTNYNFNNTEKNIQSFFKTPILEDIYVWKERELSTSTDFEIPVNNIEFFLFKPFNVSVSCLRSVDQKKTDGYYFGFVASCKNPSLDPFVLSDDTDYQKNNEEYCRHNQKDCVLTPNYIQFFTDYYDNNFETGEKLKVSIAFSIPNNYYYSISDTDFKLQHQNNIYSLFWDKWFKDLYLGIDTQTVDGQEINQNSQPAILTTKMLIESTDWNRLYYIDGSYWILNKIKDYNPNSKGFTEVELLKIQNIDNYTTNNYLDIYGNKYGYFEPETDSFVIGSDGGIVEVKYYTNLEDTAALRKKIDNLRPSGVSVYAWSYSDEGYYTYLYQIPKNEKGATYEFVNKNNISEAASGTLVTITQLSKEDSADIDFYADQYTTICFGSNEGDDTITVTYKPEKFDNITFPDAIDDLTTTTTVNYGYSASFVDGKIGSIKQYEKGSFTIKFKSNVNLVIGKTQIIYYPIKYTLGEETRTIVIKILIKGTTRKIRR